MKWSEQLVKNRIDPSVFEANPEQSPEDRKEIADIKFYCEGIFSTSQRVQKARTKIEEIKTASHSPEVVSVADEVLEELDGIADDLKFAKSRRGKFLLFANDYGQNVYKKMRVNAEARPLAQIMPNAKGCSGGEERALRVHPWLNKRGLGG